MVSQIEAKARLDYFRSKLEITKAELADRLGLSKSAFYHRERNPEKFTLGELLKLKKITGVSTIEELFLLPNHATNSNTINLSGQAKLIRKEE